MSAGPKGFMFSEVDAIPVCDCILQPRCVERVASVGVYKVLQSSNLCICRKESQGDSGKPAHYAAARTRLLRHI